MPFRSRLVILLPTRALLILRGDVDSSVHLRPCCSFSYTLSLSDNLSFDQSERINLRSDLTIYFCGTLFARSADARTLVAIASLWTASSACLMRLAAPRSAPR